MQSLIGCSGICTNVKICILPQCTLYLASRLEVVSFFRFGFVTYPPPQFPSCCALSTFGVHGRSAHSLSRPLLKETVRLGETPGNGTVTCRHWTPLCLLCVEACEACASVRGMNRCVRRLLPLHLPLKSCLKQVYGWKCVLTSIQLLRSRDALECGTCGLPSFLPGLGCTCSPPLVSSNHFCQCLVHTARVQCCAQMGDPGLHLLPSLLKPY